MAFAAVLMITVRISFQALRNEHASTSRQTDLDTRQSTLVKPD
jgi:hypothetical protein